MANQVDGIGADQSDNLQESKNYNTNVNHLSLRTNQSSASALERLLFTVENPGEVVLFGI